MGDPVADNAAGMAALDRIIEKVRGLDQLPRQVAPAVARELKRQIEANIAAGRAPDGKPWPRNKDGSQSLRTVGKDLSVRAVGTVVWARLKGPAARHHLGHVRGGKVRAILPSARMPQALEKAVERVIAKAFRRAVGGTSG